MHITLSGLGGVAFVVFLLVPPLVVFWMSITLTRIRRDLDAQKRLLETWGERKLSQTVAPKN